MFHEYLLKEFCVNHPLIVCVEMLCFSRIDESPKSYSVVELYLNLSFNLKTERVFCEMSVDSERETIYVENLHIKRRDVYEGNGRERIANAIDEIINYARSNGLKTIEYSAYGKTVSEPAVSDILGRKGFEIKSGKSGYSAVLEL